MLARLTRELPRDGYLYEPKWHGFRCLVFRDGDEVDGVVAKHRDLEYEPGPRAMVKVKRERAAARCSRSCGRTSLRSPAIRGSAAYCSAAAPPGSCAAQRDGGRPAR